MSCWLCLHIHTHTHNGSANCVFKRSICETELCDGGTRTCIHTRTTSHFRRLRRTQGKCKWRSESKPHICSGDIYKHTCVMLEALEQNHDNAQINVPPISICSMFQRRTAQSDMEWRFRPHFPHVCEHDMMQSYWFNFCTPMHIYYSIDCTLYKFVYLHLYAQARVVPSSVVGFKRLTRISYMAFSFTFSLRARIVWSDSWYSFDIFFESLIVNLFWLYNYWI